MFNTQPPEAAPAAEPPSAGNAPSPANPEAEASAPPQLTKQGSEGPGEEPDVAQRLQEIKKQLEAQGGQAPPGSQGPAAYGRAAAGGVFAPHPRPGFQDHYGALNHSGDVPMHEMSVSP